MSPRRPPPRSAFTLVEGLVAAGLAALLASTLWTAWTGAWGQLDAMERSAGLLGDACLLRDALSRDLASSVALPDAMGPATGGDPAGPVLRLPVFESYDPRRSLPIRLRTIEWRWDPKTRRVLRDGDAVLSGGLARVEFAWAPERPLELLVTLVPETAKDPDRRISFRLPGPRGSRILPAWSNAQHHRATLDTGP